MKRTGLHGDPIYRHRSERQDGMLTHVRSVLTAADLSAPVIEGRLVLGIWQSINLWGDRSRPYTRDLGIMLHGTA